MVWGVNPDIPLDLSLYGSDMEESDSLFPCTYSYLNTLRAESLRSARRVVPTASLADSSFSPNNDLELADTCAKVQDDCET